MLSAYILSEFTIVCHLLTSLPVSSYLQKRDDLAISFLVDSPHIHKAVVELRRKFSITHSLIQYNAFFGIYVKRYANAAGYHQSFFGKVNEYCGKGFDARLTSISPSMQAQRQ